MSWQNPELAESPKGVFGSFPINERCFIRKEHECGKMFSASKSCFIACPTNDDLELILGLMSEKLSKVGIEPYVAVKERSYGQDIFCTKICGKILESRFCIVILDDSIKNGSNIPNPNVYYEYGLMTALGKHIIPLQKEDLELAFNIQSYDTIKYNNKNITAELDSAIRDAIKQTEAKEPEKIEGPMDEKLILRRMELAGFFEPGGNGWIMSNVINDTGFKGFRQPEKRYIAFVGKVDDDKDLQAYMDDLNIVIYRAEKKIKELVERIEKMKIPNQRAPIIGYSISHEEQLLEMMSTIFIAFIAGSKVDLSAFLKSAREIIKDKERYKITCNRDDQIKFGDVLVDLARNACY